MGIEIALREHTFTSDLEKAVTNLILAHNWVMEKFKTDLERFNLTSQQFNILRILKAESKPLSTMQIRDRMLDKMSDTSRIVDRLVAKDLVSKKVSALDKRLVDVVITQKGMALLERLDNEGVRMENALSSLSAEELLRLNQLLGKLRLAEAEEEQVLKPIM
ncbi:MAG: MarR family transcriptional regulator [Chitinophagaceae bacterium]|nr:MarR family transcriptional regulator [Chitinophagaceae bacterium]